MASSASVFTAPAHADQRDNPSPSGSRPSGATVAAALSIILHLCIALLATRHFRGAAVTPELGDEPIELLTMEPEQLATDFEPQVETGEASPLPVQRPSTNAVRVVAQGAVARPVAAIVSAKLTQAEPTISKSESEPTPVASSAAESPAARFTITVSRTVGNAGSNPASGSATSSNSASPGGTAGTVIPSTSVDIPARLRTGSVPAYTPAALAAGIEANVPLELVISEAGLVTSARGLEHVGYGLDEAARQSVLGYRFTPAMRKNRPVPVRMRWLMRFQLR